jgi:hypothetical protein
MESSCAYGVIGRALAWSYLHGIGLSNFLHLKHNCCQHSSIKRRSATSTNVVISLDYANNFSYLSGPS